VPAGEKRRSNFPGSSELAGVWRSGGKLKLAGRLLWTGSLIRGRHWPVVKPIFRAVREHYRPMIPAAQSDALNRPARILSTAEARIAAPAAAVGDAQCKSLGE
jgi:hypothetical protein